MADETTDVAVRDDGLLSLAIEKGLDTETLAKLIALRNAEIERMAKADFDREFAAMQAELPPIGRTRTVSDNSGRKLYSFCPLEDILLAVGPVLARHGLAYRWAEEALSSGEKRVWCIISGHGHEEKSYVDIPLVDPQTRSTNKIQQRGVATSYGKRYSFMSAVGVVIAGEDLDANEPPILREPQVEIEPEPEKPADPIREQVTKEVESFIRLVGSEKSEGIAAFSDAEKAEWKARLAEINIHAKATGSTEAGMRLKLAETKKLNDEVSQVLIEKGGIGLY